MGLVHIGDFKVCLNLVYKIVFFFFFFFNKMYKIVLRRWANSMIEDWISYLPQIRITCFVLHVFSPPQKWRVFCLLHNFSKKLYLVPGIYAESLTQRRAPHTVLCNNDFVGKITCALQGLKGEESTL